VLFCVLYSIVLCIVVPLPPGTYPLAVNNNNNNNNKIHIKKYVFLFTLFIKFRQALYNFVCFLSDYVLSISVLLSCVTYWPLISMTERSKEKICSHLPAGIAVSNSAGGMSVCCECCVLSMRQADHSSRGVLPNVVSLFAIQKPEE
jgi:hypothetical protein